MPPDLSIVVPVYNEAESLPELARQIRETMDEAGMCFEVWFVDDGSDDGSWKIITALHADDGCMCGIRFRKNEGKSAALAAGFARTRGRFVATLDADLQDDPAELPEMVRRLEEGADLVSGWKKTRHDPITKTIPSRFFNAVTRLASGIPLHDFNSGIKAYRAEVIRSVRVYGELHRYIPLLARWEGYTRIEEQVVNHRPRKYGVTKFGLERFLRGFLDLISVVFLTRFMRRPMHFFGGLGTLGFVLGFLILLYLTGAKLIGGEAIGDRPLLLFGVMLILLGAQSFLAGLLGEMVVRPEMEDVARIDVREVADASSSREMPSGEEKISPVHYQTSSEMPVRATSSSESAK